jgi:hypothetical protein
VKVCGFSRDGNFVIFLKSLETCWKLGEFSRGEVLNIFGIEGNFFVSFLEMELCEFLEIMGNFVGFSRDGNFCEFLEILSKVVIF